MQEPIAWISRLFLAQPEGMGAKLIAAAAEFAKSVGAIRLSLSTAVTNKTAQALYEASGWKKDEQFFHYEYAL